MLSCPLAVCSLRDSAQLVIGILEDEVDRNFRMLGSHVKMLGAIFGSKQPLGFDVHTLFYFEVWVIFLLNYVVKSIHFVFQLRILLVELFFEFAFIWCECLPRFASSTQVAPIVYQALGESRGTVRFLPSVLYQCT